MFDIYLSSKELSSKKIIRGLYKVYRSIVTFLNNRFRIIEITFLENMRLIVRCERRRESYRNLDCSMPRGVVLESPFEALASQERSWSDRKTMHSRITARIELPVEILKSLRTVVFVHIIQYVTNVVRQSKFHLIDISLRSLNRTGESGIK